MGIRRYFTEIKLYVGVMCVLILTALFINETSDHSYKRHDDVIDRDDEKLNNKVGVELADKHISIISTIEKNVIQSISTKKIDESIKDSVKADDNTYPHLSKSNGIKIFRYINGRKVDYNSYKESLPAKSTHKNSEGKFNLFSHIDDIYGTANRMFMYTSGYGIAKKTNRTFYFKSNLPIFNLFSDSDDGVNIFTNDYLHIEIKPTSVFKKGIFDLPEENIIVHPFLQRWKYFSHCEQDIRQQFDFRDGILNWANEYLSTVRINLQLKKDTKVIGLHIRRGDMMAAHMVLHGSVVADKLYLDRAIMHFKTKYECVFIVCIDDLDWAKTALEEHKSYVTFSEGHTGNVDMAILSLTDHMIMTVGTFGWWAAYLNNGEVVYFKNWPRKGSELDTFVNKEDRFPSHWIAL